MTGMSLTPTEIQRETGRLIRRLHAQIGEDIRRMRLDANVSVAALARATALDAAHLGRIEAGTAHPSTKAIAAIGVALGADLSVRYFPGARPQIHDRFQAPMIEALLRSLHRRWEPALEVLVTHPSRGVIDLVLTDLASELQVATEVQSDLRRLEHQIRRSREKAESLTARRMSGADEPVDLRVSQLLILRSTVRTRELARQYNATLRAAFPARAADAYASLTTPVAPWPGPAIVWIHLHGSKANLMRHPPPGVDLGR